MIVGNACNTAVVLATAEEPLVEAARRMRDFHVGSVIVVSDLSARRPIGMLTDRDIVVSAVAQSPDRVTSLSVGDVMSADVVTVPEGSGARSSPPQDA
jgi:CBS domain-containing protein